MERLNFGIICLTKSSNDPEYMKEKVIYAYEHNLLEVDC